MKPLDELKREVFFRLLDLAGRVYIQVRYSDAVRIGRRGFLAEEKEEGLVLVLNQKMKFTWDDEGIHTTLLFGTAPEKCFIPAGDIVAVYSPELGAQFVTSLSSTPGSEESGDDADNLIKVDFTKRKP
jgi:hypothetical protein